MSQVRKAELDRNLVVVSKVNRPGIVFYDASEEPFRLYGLSYSDSGYCRVPREVAERVSPNVLEMHGYTAGGRIRFVTNSPYVAVHVKLKEVYTTPFMTYIATHGFDVYSDNLFAGALIPPEDPSVTEYESLVNLGSREEKVITINLPLYTNVERLYIGLDEASSVSRAPDYTYECPIVFYGSSITHGCSASRPGLTYESIISRRFDTNYVNLGFGGSAKAEEAMAEYVASLDAQIFVYDYDYNAPTVKYLSETHQRMFRTYRASHPDTPIVMVSRPRSSRTEDNDARFAVIKATYDEARASGDCNVYLIDGIDFFTGLGNDWSIDRVHPNDHGFARMAAVIGDVIGDILSKSL